MRLPPPRAPFRRHCFIGRRAAFAVALVALSAGVPALAGNLPAEGRGVGDPGAKAAPLSTEAAAKPVPDPAAAKAPPEAAGKPDPGAGAPKAVPQPSWAEQQSALCAAAVHDSETRYPVPGGLLGTIAKVESGRPISAMSDVRAWPWTIDADGRGYFFESKAAAVAWAKLALARGGVNFMDIGCMQVDLQMHPGAFRSIDDAFDPATNVDYGARYLRQLHDADANGNWYVAVGLYHSHTPMLAAAYRDRVAAVGAGIVTGFRSPEPLYMRALRQGTLRLALAGGGTLILHINRQPSLRPHLRLSPCQLVAFLGADLPARAQRRGCTGRG